MIDTTTRRDERRETLRRKRVRELKYGTREPFTTRRHETRKAA